MRLHLLALIVTLGATAIAAERPAVIDAARNGDRAALRALIQRKADVNQPDGDGATALHWAAYHDDLESVDLLTTAGANVNAANDLGATPLWNASTNAAVPVAKRLLEAGANPNLALLAGETPLIAVAAAVPSFAQDPPPASSSETRPATTTVTGDTGLWFVPTGEVLPAKKWSFSAYRVTFGSDRG